MSITTPIPAGTQIATDTANASVYPRTKLSHGDPGSAVDVSMATPLPTTEGYLPAGTNRSGTITTGATAQQLAVANPTRRGLTGQNISSGDLWLNEIGGSAAVGVNGSYKIGPGEMFAVSTNRVVSIIGATTGQAFTATEY